MKPCFQPALGAGTFYEFCLFFVLINSVGKHQCDYTILLYAQCNLCLILSIKNTNTAAMAT